MNPRRYVTALIAAFSLCAASAAPVLSATVVRQADPAADLVGTELLVQAGLDRQTPRQNGLAALVAECILQTPVALEGAQGVRMLPLREAVSAVGGSISYVVEPRDVRFYLEGITRSYATMLALLRQSLAKPDFSSATFESALAALNQKSTQSQQLALNVGIDMLNRAFYQDSGAGLPPYGLPATLAGLTAADAQAFYARHYRRGDAIVSVAGDLNAISGDPFAHLADVLPEGSSPALSSRMPSLPSSSRELIARRDIPVPWLVAQYPAPDIASKDFGAMLVLTSFMRHALSDVSQIPSIATVSPTQRGVGALYNFDTHPANVIVYVDGGQGDPTRTFATALTVVNVLGHAKLGGDLSEMKSLAVGHFLEGAQSLEDRAWLGAVFASQHLPPDYEKHALKAIDETTAEDLQRVAARYLGVPTIALVLPRNQQALQSP